MRALATTSDTGGLSVVDLPTPEPAAGEVRVRIRASAVGPADHKVLRGEFVGTLLHGKGRPLVVGYDLAGTVDALGKGVVDFAVGDEVFGFLAYDRSTRHGCWAEYAVLPAANVARRPPTLGVTTAAALATGGVTALQGLRDSAGAVAGQRVLVVGAAGGVGSVGVAVARRLELEVTAICSESAAELVTGWGAAHILPRGKVDPLTHPGRYHILFDTAAVYSWTATRHLLESGGSYVTTLPGPGLVPGALFGWATGTRSTFVLCKSRRADLELLAGWAAAGMPVPIDSSFPVRDAAKAFERLARGGMKGKVVIDVEGGW